MALQKKTFDSNQLVRYVAVGALTIAAFLGAYRFAQAKSASAEQNPAAVVAAASPAVSGAAATAPNASATGASNAAPGSAAAGCGGSCCGGASGGSAGGGSCCGGSGGGSTATVPGKTTVTGGVQRVTIDLTTGSYSPNQITAKAGIPIELVFKGPASGCNGTVVSQQLGFQQDVSNGGTIKVSALKPGTYQWTCGMGMYIGRIVVQ